MDDKNQLDSKTASLKRVIGATLLAIINPISDFKFFYRAGIKPLVVRIKDLRQGNASPSRELEEFSFDQAVARSGKTVEDLKSIYSRRLFLWSIVMISLGALALINLSLIMIASDLPRVTLSRGITWGIIMASLSYGGYTQSSIAAYRHWQLINRRRSAAEGGTYADFKKQVSTFDIVSLHYLTRKWK